MRPLALAFPEQQRAWDCDDQFLFGADLLVAPVYEFGARERSVWLPEGASWTDAWTGQIHPGGQEILVAAPLERLPLFLRDGAFLPIL